MVMAMMTWNEFKAQHAYQWKLAIRDGKKFCRDAFEITRALLGWIMLLTIGLLIAAFMLSCWVEAIHNTIYLSRAITRLGGG
jgi:hypothetical protein